LFDWSTLPRLIEQTRSRRHWVITLIGDFVPLFVIVLGCVILLATCVGELLIGFILILALGAAHTLVELGPACLALGAPTWRRLVAWWEGVLAGYGVWAITILCAGYGTCLCDRRWCPGEMMRFLPLLLLVAVELCVVQCIIVRWRMARFGERIPTGRLVLGCMLAKAITAAILIGQPFRVIGRF